MKKSTTALLCAQTSARVTCAESCWRHCRWLAAGANATTGADAADAADAAAIVIVAHWGPVFELW
jgi:hypothetical protein